MGYLLEVQLRTVGSNRMKLSTIVPGDHMLCKPPDSTQK
ncbi:hypothetical protein OU5_P0467 (plasmid) [Pseudomonas mandelii JR-1]|uniref:Uncharacterized protein n=1 Tax=Pseudomonas mandelii JR-1 TaxID=1147786 RepID=A0A024ELG5_9PSED|nr:hypothetical protein OU5_P0467 [Pseudomonas mandelii JR-1]